jgi:hypothetical protein
MFPQAWHVATNLVFLVQTFICILYFFKRNIFLPVAHHGDYHMEEIQFRGMLIFHCMFYVAELVLTDIISDFTSMSVHHILAIVIFLCMFYEPDTICVFSLLPYALHMVYWVTGGENEYLLFFYNIYFFLLGMFMFRHAQQEKVISIFVPSLSIALPLVNYFSYCVWFDGSFCIDDATFPVASFSVCTFIVVLVGIWT